MALLWQGVVANAAWWILAGIGSVMIAIYRNREKRWVTPTLYGIVTFACLTVIWFTATGRPLVRPTPDVTEDNIEDHVKTWADHLSIGLQREDEPGSYFRYAARGKSGDTVRIYRAKDRPGYLQFESSLSFSPEHVVALSKMSPKENQIFDGELELEIARTGLSFVLVASKDNKVPRQITLQNTAFIANLDEASFGSYFDQETRMLEMLKALVNMKLPAA